MKYKWLLLLLCFSVILMGCSHQVESINNQTSQPVLKEKEILNIEKIINNLYQYSWEIIYSTDTYWNNLSILWTWDFLSLQKLWNSWSLIISDRYNNKEEINEKLVITWWKLYYNNIFSINIPQNILWRWGVLYENQKNINNIFINSEWYDDVIAPKWVSVNITNLESLTWYVCNPYDLVHFTQEYWNTMQKKWYFSTTKKNIDNREIVISYLKRYYSDSSDSSSQWLFNGRVGTYCMIKENKRYTITVALMDKKNVDNILNSFQFLQK